MDDSTDDRTSLLLPWYALVITGILISGFFTWCIVVWVLFKHGKKGAASAALAFIILFGTAVYYSGGLVYTVWWKAGLIDLALHIALAVSAALLQARILGQY